MLEQVDVGERFLAAYRGIAPDAQLRAVRAASEPLRGLRVVHVSATPYGGGVSELLRSTVPLLNDLGLAATWKVITGDEPCFATTKRIHNGLQGALEGLGEHDREAYLQSNRHNAAAFEDAADVVFVHDPQPAGLLHFGGRRNARWIWRCHVDTSEPNAEIWSFLIPLLEGYDAAIFTMQTFAPPHQPIPRVEIMAPAIDPLSPKNLPLPDSLISQILGWIGIRLDRPLVTQVSRFDPWKDPLGVIAAYRSAREELPDVQLALVGSMAFDDPEGWEIYHEIQEVARQDPLIHVFTNLTGVSNTEANAFQRYSDVVVQKSIREGFGLVISEAMWKGTPVVAGRAGGIPTQMGGTGGLLVDGVEECARGIVRLLRDQELARHFGAGGRERVRRHYLLPRLLLDELRLIQSLV
jgi:trehalose synthase